jgi:hypothetical protein
VGERSLVDLDVGVVWERELLDLSSKVGLIGCNGGEDIGHELEMRWGRVEWEGGE